MKKVFLKMKFRAHSILKLRTFSLVSSGNNSFQLSLDFSKSAYKFQRRNFQFASK